MDGFSKLSRRALLGCPLASSPFAVTALGALPEGKPAGGLVDFPRIRRDFPRDGRSMKVVFVAHCIINQNARHYNCADFPAMMEPVLEFLRASQIGIIQMGCPELKVLGLGRDRDEPPVNTIREALQLPGARPRLDAVVEDVIFQINEYRFQGFDILGIVGKNGSPSCGVEGTYAGGKHVMGLDGIFVQHLKKALKSKKLDVPIKGVYDHRQGEIIAWLKQRLKR